MKKILLFVIIFILCVSAFCSMNIGAQPKLYLALGDSITTGFGLEDTAFAFPERVSSKLNIELASRGVDGSEADDIYNRLQTGELDDVISSAGLITVTAGGNDMLEVLYNRVAQAYNKYYQPEITADDVTRIIADSSDNRRITLALRVFSVLSGTGEQPPLAESDDYTVTLEKYRQNISDISDYIRNINKDAQIVITTQYNPYKTFENTDFSTVYASVDACISKLNEVILSVAREKGLAVADVYTAFCDSEQDLCNSDADLMNLDFHPNSAGHGVIADCIARVVSVKKSVFSDVLDDDWFYDAVKFVYDNGFMNGVGDDKFSPDAYVTRGMLVTMLYRAEGSPEVSEGVMPFADVNADSYYGDAVAWARDNDIVNGYSESEFAPDASITREQLSSIILRYCTYKGTGPVGAWAIRLDYSDLGEVSDYAAKSVMYCTMKGYMSGRDDGTFAPKAFTTRAEAAAILYRILR